MSPPFSVDFAGFGRDGVLAPATVVAGRITQSSDSTRGYSAPVFGTPALVDSFDPWANSASRLGLVPPVTGVVADRTQNFETMGRGQVQRSAPAELQTAKRPPRRPIPEPPAAATEAALVDSPAQPRDTRSCPGQRGPPPVIVAPTRSSRCGCTRRASESSAERSKALRMSVRRQQRPQQASVDTRHLGRAIAVRHQHSPAQRSRHRAHPQRAHHDIPNAEVRWSYGM